MSVLTGITATAAAAVLAVGALAGASLASADASPSSSSASSTSSGSSTSSESGGGLTKACAHVDKQLARATKLQTRLHADAGSKGSIAFLQARIDKANGDGHTALAHVLEDRMAIRRQVDSQLPGVISHLNDAKSTCVAAGEKA